MPTLVIVGAQWGDEAKGKIVDVLGAEADFVVRYSGGNNAGHTVIVAGEEHKFHLLPAGILHPGVTAVLGGGMVVCPPSLLSELDRTGAGGRPIGQLVVSPAAHVVFPYHRLLDQLEEEARGANKIGTTSRGIGPAYTDKVQRHGIRMGEFVRPEIFERRLREVLAVKNRLLSMFGAAEIEFEALFQEYSRYAERLRPHVAEVAPMLQAAVAEGKHVMFEGAQGTFLDLDHGTYPYVTSSHPTAGGACLGTGIGPRDIGSVLGVCKAYTTRVGSGPFPTELTDEVGELIRDQGQEFGTTTGRARRCGWLDLVALRHSCRINSMSGLILTRLDILGGIGDLKVCLGYRRDGMELHSPPSLIEDWSGIEPVYTTVPGWDEDLRSVRGLQDLPQSARDYLELVESHTGVPIAILSIGPARDETAVLRPDLIWAR
ncbi:MAG: adenylosuccinate synthase [Fimbriimonadaceae bacterium]|nr:adenylosuccinate synthase [Fimbriimonadaceae bacterium]QYK57691.1 MAG: adenylosuccinate synthase [Fimbriimonadaceae bacterium]